MVFQDANGVVIISQDDKYFSASSDEFAAIEETYHPLEEGETIRRWTPIVQYLTRNGKQGKDNFFVQERFEEYIAKIDSYQADLDILRGSEEEGNFVYVHIMTAGGDGKTPPGVQLGEVPLYIHAEIRLGKEPDSMLVPLSDEWRIAFSDQPLTRLVQFVDGVADFQFPTDLPEGDYQVDESKLTPVTFGGVEYTPVILGQDLFRVYAEAKSIQGTIPLYVFISFPDKPEGEEPTVLSDGTDFLRTVVEIKAENDLLAPNLDGLDGRPDVTIPARPFAIRRPDGTKDYIKIEINQGRAEFNYMPQVDTPVMGHYRILEEDFSIIGAYRFVLATPIDFVVFRRVTP